MRLFKLIFPMYLFIISASVEANETACGAILCLSGNGGTACSSYIHSYYAIKRFHKGDFDAGATSAARNRFLNSCPGKNSQVVATIIQKTGRKYSP